MLSINPTLFVITFIILLLYALVIFIFKKPIRNIEMSVMEKNANVSSYLKESCNSIISFKRSAATNALCISLCKPIKFCIGVKKHPIIA